MKDIDPEKIRKKADSIPTEILMIDEHGNFLDETEERSTIILSDNVKLFLAEKMIAQKQSLETVLLRTIKSGLKEIPKPR